MPIQFGTLSKSAQLAVLSGLNHRRVEAGGKRLGNFLQKEMFLFLVGSGQGSVQSGWIYLYI